MLRVKIELVPYGDEERAKTIGEMIIANDGTGTYDNGNYQAVVAPDDWSGQPIRHCNIQNFNRRNSVWDLLEVLLSVRQDKLPKEGLYQRLKKRLKSVNEQSETDKSEEKD